MPADVVAGHIRRAGMGGLAALLLHTFKPLAWVGGQLFWMIQPFFETPGTGRQTGSLVAGLAKLLERENGVDELVEQLRTPKDKD